MIQSSGNTIASLSDSIASLGNSIASLGNSIASFGNSIASLGNSIASLGNSIESLFSSPGILMILIPVTAKRLLQRINSLIGSALLIKAPYKVGFCDLSVLQGLPL